MEHHVGVRVGRVELRVAGGLHDTREARDEAIEGRTLAEIVARERTRFGPDPRQDGSSSQVGHATRLTPEDLGHKPGAGSLPLCPCRSVAAAIPRIAGTHGKTLELTRDTQVTRRATCVLGVDSDHDDAALLALRGVVEVTLACGSLTDTFTATVTPFFLGDDSLVFRRGPALRGRTFAYESSKTAAEIDRELVRALASSNAVLDVTVQELDRDAKGVLFVVAVPIGNDDDLSPRARRVLDAADVVLAEDTRRFRDLAAASRSASAGRRGQLPRSERGGPQ